ncbi:TniQ protein [Andreprevotia lacus DSM 23236]|jgi:transposase-like protein|uniref:TniQ protein n=1 Tax=Andreprevotia lacus DSM 23236 TaxID=1121001 RepID=A0A1W1X379_9NEIS|nr:TnsD family Tn7-like transposition protein [Andreprevotia lacus]SMC18178.1 TniQ protein [Andreprevotia lacus DSM 23236]
MLAYFPSPYPDELLYSIVARFGAHTQAHSAKQLTELLFGYRSEIAAIALPGHIQALAEQLPQPQWAAETIVTQCTLYPYWLAFQPQVVQAQVLFAMLRGSTVGLAFKLGMRRDRMHIPDQLRACPYCIEEMRQRYGEPYWRRSHQLPGVLVCPEHGEPLMESNVPAPLSNRHAFMPAISVLSLAPQIHLPLPVHWPQLQCLAGALGNLLGNPPEARVPLAWRSEYKQQLLAKGYGRGSSIGLAKLSTEMESFYAPVAHYLLPGDLGDMRWVQAMYRSRGVMSPLFHVLLQLFLDECYPVAAPFGIGPWPCLNPLEPHFGQFTVDHVETHHNRDGLVGRFECRCGYVYTRRVDAARGGLTNPRPLRYGARFFEQLAAFLQQGLGLRAIARRLQVDPATAKRAILQMTNTELTTDKACAELQSRRQGWLALRNRLPTCGRKALALASRGLYHWLRKHDAPWLLAHMPPRRGAHEVKTHDWDAKDRYWQACLPAIAAEISKDEPPKRVTLAELARRSGFGRWLCDHVHQLPLTRSTVNVLCESTEAFQIRRLHWTAAQMKKDHQPIVAWRLRRRATLPSHVSPQVEGTVASIVQVEWRRIHGQIPH